MWRDDAFDALNTTALVLCISFCAYVVVILMIYLRKEPEEYGDPRRLAWHIIVPCLNEAAVIESTVATLLQRLPRVTVWCVDDGSDDGTDALLARLTVDHRVRVITRRAPQARLGKGAALNAAWHELRKHEPADPRKVVVGVLDADSVLDPYALRVLAGRVYFGDPEVSAVQIEVRMSNPSGSRWARLLVRLQDLEFRGPIAAMQELRRRTGSVGLGGNGQFTRLSTLDDIAVTYGSPWHGALLEDFELGLHVLLVGGRTEYCGQTWVAQEGLIRTGALMRQRTRWVQGSMQCLRYLPTVLRSPRVPNSAALEIGYFLASPWTQLMGTLVYLGCLGVVGGYALNTPGSVAGWWHHGGWALIPLVVFFGVAPFAVWGLAYRSRCEPSLSRTTAIALGMCHWLYSYAQAIAVWRALARHVRARTDWQKTSRIAESVTRRRSAVHI